MRAYNRAWQTLRCMMNRFDTSRARDLAEFECAKSLHPRASPRQLTMPTDPISVKQARRPKQKEQHAPHHEAGEIRVGPAGWSYDDWHGVVYPAHPRARFNEARIYAQFFDTIEINTSFYQPLRPDYAEQSTGRVAANPQFQFTAKLWQRFTHEGGGNAEDERIVRTEFEPLVQAGKLTVLLDAIPFFVSQHSRQHRVSENTDRSVWRLLACLARCATLLRAKRRCFAMLRAPAAWAFAISISR